MQTYSPFGLRPAYHSAGIVRPGPVSQIASGYGTNIFTGYPVVITTAGQMQVVAPGDDNLWNGVFSGVEYNDTLGRRNYLNRWIANTVLPTNADLRAYYTADDVGLVYEIQANDTLTIAAIGEQYNFTALSGNSVTGLASVGLDVSSAVGSGDQGQMRVIGLRRGPDNDWGDPYPVVLVQNAAHPWVGRVNVQA